MSGSNCCFLTCIQVSQGEMGKQFMVQPYKKILFSHHIFSSVQYACMLSHFSHIQLFMTLLDCSLVHDILQARMLEWAAISFSRGSSRPSDQTCIYALAHGFFTTNTTWESYIYIYTHTHIHIYIYIYICMYIHVYIHTGSLCVCLCLGVRLYVCVSQGQRFSTGITLIISGDNWTGQLVGRDQRGY